MKRIIALITTLLILAGLFIGCGGSGTASEKSTNAAGQGYPMKVTDAGSFEMTIEKQPSKIVSLTLGTDEMLLGLIDSSRIKALTNYADDEGISNVAKEAKNVKDRVTWDSVEKIIELQPDLVFADTWADPKAVKQLRDAKITVYVFKTPSGIEEQKSAVTEIAHIVGADSEGKKLTDWMDEKLKAVDDRLKALKPEQKLKVMDYGEMGSSGKGTNFDSIVTRAGLINVVSNAGMDGWPKLSKEKMIEFNPDVIILPSWYYDKKNTLQGMIDTFKNDKSLAGIKAVQNNRLVSVPNPHISAISQYVVLAVEDVAKAAYPELFK